MSELTGEESMAGHTKLMCEFGCVPKTIKSVGSWQGKVTVCNQCIEQLKHTAITSCGQHSDVWNVRAFCFLMAVDDLNVLDAA